MTISNFFAPTQVNSSCDIVLKLFFHRNWIEGKVGWNNPPEEELNSASTTDQEEMNGKGRIDALLSQIDKMKKNKNTTRTIIVLFIVFIEYEKNLFLFNEHGFKE